MDKDMISFEGAPKLGYLSRGQLEEFAINHEDAVSKRGSKQLSTTLWFRLHWFGTSLDEETGIRYFRDATHQDAELGILTDDPEIDSLINLDAVEHLIETEELARVSDIGKKALSLAQSYIDQRKALLS